MSLVVFPVFAAIFNLAFTATREGLKADTILVGREAKGTGDRTGYIQAVQVNKKHFTITTSQIHRAKLWRNPVAALNRSEGHP